MATAEQHPAGARPVSGAARPFPPLPEPRHVAGPVSRAVMKRTAAIVGAIWLAGLVLDLANPSAGWTAFGLGLLLPGGGFAYAQSWVALVLAPLAFAAAFGLFYLLSPMWLPVVVWLGAAVLAAAAADGGDTAASARTIVPVVLAGLVLLGLIGRNVTLARLRRSVRERNAHLAERSWDPPAAGDSPRALAPMTDDELAAVRFMLDLALQPLDRFDGFGKIDQFREAAYRYQLNTIGWALSMAQFTRIPAFSGYVDEAQRNAIEKMLHPKVWGYWRWENLIGNLRWNPDPVRHDNIMLPGYYVVQIGTYETVSGDDRYSRPGALVFRDRRHEYTYDFASMSQCVRDNIAGARMCMYSCEPNWVFPSCNFRAMNGLLLHDRLHGTDLAASVHEGFSRATVEEFAHPDDRVVTMRSNRLGFAVPQLGASALADADIIFWLSPVVPDIGARRWELFRHVHTEIAEDGTLQMRNLGPLDGIDPGNYRPSKAWMYAAVMASAREFGDEEIYAAAKARLDADCSPAIHDGALHLDGSVWAQNMASLARLARPHAWHDLITRGMPAAWRDGPRLAEAPYPEALVALAVGDGAALDLELVPGNGGGRVDLVLDRLTPGATYRLEGAVDAHVVATADGRAAMSVDLDRRRRVRLAPPA